MTLAAKSVRPILAAILVFGYFARAQDAENSQATASIAGTVLDSVTRQPLRAVEVRARTLSPGQGNSKPGIEVSTTDAEGHFTIEGLAPGRYFLFASQQSYVGQRMTGGGSRGRALSLAPDQHLSDLTIELIPGAVVSGTIKNADGKPMSGVSLEVVAYVHIPSGRQLSSVTTPSPTDASGKYRVAGVRSGEYYLLAIPPAVSPASKVAAKDAFAPTYYPNSLDVTTAAALSLRPGEDLAGMDITFTPVHAVTIEGKVSAVGMQPPLPGAQLTLIRNDAVTFQREVNADAKGVFRLEAVPSGDYTVVARVEPGNSKGKMLFGQRRLLVRDSNLRNVELRIGPGVAVSGRVHVDEKANVDLSRINCTLWPQGNSSVTALMPDVTNVTLSPDGAFTFTDVPEGTHVIDFRPLPPGYFLKSSGSVDALETGFAVSNGQSPQPLDLTLSPNAAQLTGSVASAQMPVAGAAVVLLPESSRKGIERFFKRATTDQSGHFTLKSIVPGDYRVLAFDGADRILLSNPDFLERFEAQGESVHLQEGDSVNVSLDAIRADEASP